MSYKLFIDDLRDPVTSDWKVARSSVEAKDIVVEFGIPNEIAFDHDLGGDDTSIVFINWLINKMLDEDLKLPEGFKFSIHSMNPVGVENIKSLMTSVVKEFN